MTTSTRIQIRMRKREKHTQIQIILCIYTQSTSNHIRTKMYKRQNRCESKALIKKNSNG